MAILKLQFQTEKLLRHTAQPCELVDGASFVLADKVIWQQKLYGKGVRLALDAVCVERERVGADPACICVRRTYGVAKFVREDEAAQVLRRALGIDEDGLHTLVLEIRPIDGPAQVYVYDVYTHRAGKSLRIVCAVPADELLYLLSNIHAITSKRLRFRHTEKD